VQTMTRFDVNNRRNAERGKSCDDSELGQKIDTMLWGSELQKWDRNWKCSAGNDRESEGGRAQSDGN